MGLWFLIHWVGISCSSFRMVMSRMACCLSFCCNQALCTTLVYSCQRDCCNHGGRTVNEFMLSVQRRVKMHVQQNTLSPHHSHIRIPLYTIHGLSCWLACWLACPSAPSALSYTTTHSHVCAPVAPQAQTVIADNLGLGIAVLMSPLLHATQR